MLAVEEIAGAKMDDQIIVPQAWVGSAKFRLDQCSDVIGEDARIIRRIQWQAKRIQLIKSPFDRGS